MGIRSFEDWLADSVHLRPEEPELPDGFSSTVDIRGRTVYTAACRACGRDFEWDCDIAPWESDPYYVLCFGGPGCVP